jgi:enoyl-CoA hydratase/carnithine racemase
LPRIVNGAQALDMLLTGRSVAAEEAHMIGLLNRLVPAGGADQAAIEIAHQLSRASAPALQAIHRCVDAAESGSLGDGLTVEAAEEQRLIEYGEAREGINAFVERRAPSFRRHGEATLDPT